MKKRILAAALAAACLTGCGAQEPQQLPRESGEEEVTVAYVPLDDRPVNTCLLYTSWWRTCPPTASL